MSKKSNKKSLKYLRKNKGVNMKIGRIKEIKDIGAFANFKNGGSLSFEKLTFIYGLNTYGKTTLADIFQSLKQKDPQLIKNRKTIPYQLESQKVILTEKDQKENDIIFQDNQWQENSLSSHLEVFGSDFVYKNLFTGLNIERKNKKNFTQFILGEQGVKITKEIESKKQESQEKKKNLKTTTPLFVKGKEDDVIEQFLKFSIEGLNLQKVREELIQKISEWEKEKKRIEKPQKILGMEEPDQYTTPKINIIGLMDSINEIFQKDYSEIKDEILKKLNQHLEEHFPKQNGAENWIKEGLDYCKNKTNCPFCGQPLTTAQDLIENYHSYFDQAYTSFIQEIENALSKNCNKIENSYFSEKSKIQTVLTKANKFKVKDLITDNEFQQQLDELEELINKLDEDRLNDEKNSVFEKIKTNCDIKNKKPYKKIEALDCSEFKKHVKLYMQSLFESEQKIKKIKIHIDKFKELYRDTHKIKEKINHLEKEVKELEYKKARIEQNEDCLKYIDLEDKIEKLDQNVNELRKKLEKEQSEYLEKYFFKINELFKNFGSKDFTLEKKIDKRGNMTVCSLKVKFRKEEIQNEQLKNTFSDSDRRALALSVFLSKIKLKEDFEKQKLTVILDDPITSFDDIRITSSINLFRNILGKIDQMIILTHYPQFIKRFCEITHSESIKILQIKQDTVTSFLEQTNKDFFLQNEYQKAFEKIYGFINKNHSKDIKTNLRPFFENHLKMIFAKKIKDENINCNDLKSMIDGIFKDNKEVKNKMNGFRETLNPASHIITSDNEENIRNFARELMDHLYSIKLYDNLSGNL